MPTYTGSITLTDLSDGSGLTTWNIFIYKRSDTTSPATTPDTPVGGTYNYANRSVVPPVGWSNTIPAGTNVVYVSTVVISYTESSGTTTLSGWSAPVPYTQFLPNGAYYIYVDGISTYVPNAYLATVYTRVTTGNFPDAPTGGSVSLGGIGQASVVRPPDGWFVNIQSITPATQDPVWFSTAQIISVSDTVTYTPTWNTPNFLYQATGQIGGVRIIRSGPKPAQIPPPTTTEMSSVFGRSYPVFGDVVIITYSDTSVALRWAFSVWSVVTQLIDGSLVVTGSITSDSLATNSITSDKIVANAITANKMAANSITVDNAAIQDATITNAKIVDATITTAKIQDAAITNAKIGNAAINTANIVDAAITTAKIGNAAITSAKIGNAAITTANIGDAVITTAKIGTAQIDTLRVANNAITQTTSAYTAAGTNIFGGYVTLQTLNVTISTQQSIFIYGSFYSSVIAGGGVYVYGGLGIALFRGSTQILSEVNLIYYGGSLSIAFIDTPSAGTYTYTMQVNSSNIQYSDSSGPQQVPGAVVNASNRLLMILLAKR